VKTHAIDVANPDGHGRGSVSPFFRKLRSPHTPT